MKKNSERHIYQRKKTQSEIVFLNHIRHLVSAMQGDTHSPHKTKDAVSNARIRHLHDSNHVRNSYVLLVYTTGEKRFISLSPLVRACVLVIG